MLWRDVITKALTDTNKPFTFFDIGSPNKRRDGSSSQHVRHDVVKLGLGVDGDEHCRMRGALERRLSPADGAVAEVAVRVSVEVNPRVVGRLLGCGSNTQGAVRQEITRLNKLDTMSSTAEMSIIVEW